MKLLLVEDEPRIGRFIAEGLEEIGHVVDIATDGEKGVALAASNPYDVIILDIMLPGAMDGFDVASHLRARDDSTPIVMLTARDSQSDIVRGLDAGADDYLTKPFEFLELAARVRALGRRRRSDGADVLRFGPIDLDRRSRTVRCAGDPVRLTPTEFRILEVMMQSPDRPVERQQLRRSIWGLDFDPGTRIVDVHVANLRGKLEAGGRPRIITTVRGVGFQLVKDDKE